MSRCQGYTKYGTRCKRLLSKDDYCKSHVEQSYTGSENGSSEKDICPVCYEEFKFIEASLECNHKVHRECIIKSGKAQCPICRYDLTIHLNKKQLSRLDNIRRSMEEERIEEEHQELIRQATEHGGIMVYVDVDANNMDDELVSQLLSDVFNMLRSSSTLPPMSYQEASSPVISSPRETAT